MRITTPVGNMPDYDRLVSLTPSLAAAAQKVYEAWDQVDGFDEELGAGGICQDIAAAMSCTMGEHGFEHVLSVSSSVGENHVFLVALIENEGVFEVDVPFRIYEQGSGYVFRKIPNVTIEDRHVVIERLSDPISPDEFYQAYSD